MKGRYKGKERKQIRCLLGLCYGGVFCVMVCVLFLSSHSHQDLSNMLRIRKTKQNWIKYTIVQSSSSLRSHESQLLMQLLEFCLVVIDITVMDKPCMWLQCEWHNQVFPVHAETQSNPTHKQTLTWVWYNFLGSYLKS